MLRLAMPFLFAGLILCAGGCCSMSGMFSKYSGSYVDACDSCGGGGCGRCIGWRPGNRIRSANCARGCGETYYGPWRNHPPNRCDPCDGYVVGPRWCPRLLSLPWRILWGSRDRVYQGACCEPERGVPCDTCGSNVIYDGPVVEEYEAAPTKIYRPAQKYGSSQQQGQSRVIVSQPKVITPKRYSSQYSPRHQQARATTR